ncbi:MAG TPA: PAS domain-containing protein [Salinimicrobium sp.]|nr:PAS domain-containing protein [Salinimicrobium sp.]
MTEKTLKPSARKTQNIKVDLETYFANTIIPQLFVDANLVLRIFTPPAMKQFSLSEADLGKKIHDIQDNIKYPTIVENIEEVIHTEKILEKEIQTTDGRWYQMNILPYLEKTDNRCNGVIMTFVDITTRISTIAELEKLNADHNILLHTLSHDIRQPISTMSLLTGILVKSFQDKNEKQFIKFIGTLKNTIESMKSIIEDFSVDSKEDETSDEEARWNIENICDNVLSSLHQEIAKNKIEVIKDFQTSEITFPKNYLRSILYSLVERAIKQADSKRPLQIRISSEKIDGFVVLTVADNGKDLSELEQQQVFKKPDILQQQIDHQTKSLHVLQIMLSNRGGRMEMESNAGKGSVFKAYFKSGYKKEIQD